MFRALSTRAHRGYEKLNDEYKDKESTTAALLDEAKLNRTRSLPAHILSLSPKKTPSSEQSVSASSKALSKQAKKASKIHPMFNLFDIRLRKKATANPEFSRYLQYLKEGGILHVSSNK